MFLFGIKFEYNISRFPSQCSINVNTNSNGDVRWKEREKGGTEVDGQMLLRNLKILCQFSCLT